MPPRAGSGCVVRNTQVIPMGSSTTEAIANIRVVNDLLVTFTSPVPILISSSTLNNIKPIKSLTGSYVYPLYRYHYTNGDDGCKILRIRVEIPASGTVPQRSTRILTSFLHPFMNRSGKIIPAYCIEKDMEIFVDPPADPSGPKLGRVVSVVRVCWQDVYGLKVGDEAHATAAFGVTEELVALTNGELAKHWEENSLQQAELELPPSRREAEEFAYGTFFTLLNERLPKEASQGTRTTLRLNGLLPEEHMIITDSIATGTLDVQMPYYKSVQDGVDLNALIT